MIRKFTIESFKSIESAQVDLGNVNVFIGANGSGKSNLLEGFGVLAAAASGRVDVESLLRRGCRPSGLNRPLFPTSPVDADTVVTAEGDHASYSASLSSPGRNRPTGRELDARLRSMLEWIDYTTILDLAPGQGSLQASADRLDLGIVDRFLRTDKGGALLSQP
ncbi:MAG: AAA family ATPase [Limisphaerales bacterium]